MVGTGLFDAAQQVDQRIRHRMRRFEGAHMAGAEDLDKSGVNRRWIRTPISVR